MTTPTEALDKLLQAAEEVQRYGAQTGPQWMRLGAAIIKARTDLAAALAQPQQPAGWRDISSAPKDGSEFIAIWMRQGNVQQIVKWDKIHSYWQSKGDPILGFEANASYWQPLPAPLGAHPAEQQEGDDDSTLCPRCEGSGEETVYSDNGPDAREETIFCTHCMGRGGLLDAYNGVVETLKKERIAHLHAAGQRLLGTTAAEQEGGDATLRNLIADDAYAATFQSMGQYRAALLRATAMTGGSQ